MVPSSRASAFVYVISLNHISLSLIHPDSVDICSIKIYVKVHGFLTGTETLDLPLESTPTLGHRGTS